MGFERTALFVVSSKTFSSDDIVARLGVEPDDVGSDVGGAYWEVSAGGRHDVSLDDLMERVVRRVLPVEPELRALTDDGATCLLRIVAYLSPDDVSGGGFCLTREQVGFLGRVDAFVDSDLYAVGDHDP